MTKHIHPKCEDDCGCDTAPPECPNPCPIISYFREVDDECQLEWEVLSCGSPGGVTVLLSSTTVDYGEMPLTGSMFALGNTTYTLRVKYPGCSDVTATVAVGNTCPCDQGCRTGGLRGQVAGGWQSATIIVSDYTAVSTRVYSTILGCFRTEFIDYTQLNHTATFNIRTRIYDNGVRNCTVNYIEPQEYRIGTITTRVEHEGVGRGLPRDIARARFDVFGVIRSANNGVRGIVDDGFQMRAVRRSTTQLAAGRNCRTQGLFAVPVIPPLDAQPATPVGNRVISSQHIHSGGFVYGSTLVGDVWHQPWCFSARSSTGSFDGDTLSLRGRIQWQLQR